MRQGNPIYRPELALLDYSTASASTLSRDAADAAPRALTNNTEMPIKPPWSPPIVTLDAPAAAPSPVFEVKAPTTLREPLRRSRDLSTFPARCRLTRCRLFKRGPRHHFQDVDRRNIGPADFDSGFGSRSPLPHLARPAISDRCREKGSCTAPPKVEREAAFGPCTSFVPKKLVYLARRFRDLRSGGSTDLRRNLDQPSICGANRGGATLVSSSHREQGEGGTPLCSQLTCEKIVAGVLLPQGLAQGRQQRGEFQDRFAVVVLFPENSRAGEHHQGG